ncbi:MAG: DUF4332 domain-containing protein [Saprospiraceae bacterium]|nr:DUF4332 domain-containing protein [Saprospiraceae bacterium]
MSLKKQFSKTKGTCKVTFSLPKEALQGGKKVVLIGDFNEWSVEKGIKMRAGKANYTTSLDLNPAHEYEFRYLVDQETWVNDWAADDYRFSPEFGVDNSVVVVPAIVKETPVKKEKRATVAKRAKAPAKKSAPKAKVVKRTTKKTSSNGVGASLTKIEGIGPKIASLLKKAGIKTLQDLSKAKKATLTGILKEAGSRYQMHDPSSWAKQAKLGAAGKWDALAKLQKELKGGK